MFSTVKLLITDQYFLQKSLEKFFHKRFKSNSTIGDKPFFDKTLLRAAPDLEKNFKAIRDEAKQVLERLDQGVWTGSKGCFLGGVFFATKVSM